MVFRAGILLGWFCVAAFVAVASVEATDLPERLVERALAARLGPAAGRVSVEDVEISWTERSAVIRGLALGDQLRDLELEQVKVRLGWRRDRGVVLERLETEHGRLRVSRALITGLEGLLEVRDSDTPPELPELVVRDLDIAVETPEYGDIEVGHLHAALLRDGQGRPQLSGRLIPTIGSSNTGEIFLEGRLTGEEVLEVRGAARALPLNAAVLPLHDAFDPWRELAPLASFDLEAQARWHLGRDVLPTGSARMSLAGGSIALPWLDAPDERRVRDVAVALEITFEPGQPLALWDRDAWHAVGRGQATWEDIDLSVSARLGRAAPTGQLAEAWVHAPLVPLEDRTLELAARRPWLMDLWEALRPAGTVEVAYGIGFPRGWTPEQGFIDSTHRTAAILPTGDAHAAFVGWPSRETGLRDQGFPLPVTNLRGRAHYAHRPGRYLAEEISIHDLVGQRGEDVVHVRSSMRSRPAWKRSAEELKLGPQEFHLLVESDGLTIADDMRPAFAGLVGVEGCEQIWTEYLPVAGSLGLRLELQRAGSREELATNLRVDFQDFAGRWAEFPVPFEHVNGQLHLVTEGLGPKGRAVTSIELVGRSEAARGEIRYAGRTEHGPEGPDATRWEVEVRDLNLRSTRLREVLGLHDQRTLEGLEGAGVAGYADLQVTVSRAMTTAPEDIWLEATTGADGVQLVPDAFPMETRAAQGRVLATWIAREEGEDQEPPEVDLRVSMLGRWVGPGGGTPIWMSGHFPATGSGRVSVLGAGVDPLAPTLIAALESSLSRGEDEPMEIDLSTIQTDGRFDFGAELLLAPVTGEVEDGQVQVQMRLEHLGFEGIELLSNLRGAVTWNKDDDVWEGPLLAAELGRTPVSLRNVRFKKPEEGGWSLEADLTAAGLPIDREHLRFFLDARTVRTLLEEFDARGRFDIEGGRLSLAAAPDGSTALHFRGMLRVRDLFVRIGVPIEVRSAEEVELDLRIEAGRVRALARVGRLFGQVAGRHLVDTRLQLTYIEPRLTIEALDGEFEGGRLRSLGGRGGSTFFAVDLEAPFPFVLAGRMANVEVGRLLRGVFNSNFANRGRLAATMQLVGDLEHLTAIEGGGEFELSESALWAIPLFQAVLSRLGFESAATFSRMAGTYRIGDGVVAFRDLRLQSDLLSLVGAGTIDFDGSLVHDLEVRYSLLDQFGPLTRLLYMIQNSLLRISVRGDMSRPDVIVKGLFSQFFTTPTERKRLPLPSFAELPTRF